jgi:hypothetical protein
MSTYIHLYFVRKKGVLTKTSTPKTNNNYVHRQKLLESAFKGEIDPQLHPNPGKQQPGSSQL